MRERGGTGRGEKEVGEGGKWRGGWELRGVGGAKQGGRYHAKKREGGRREGGEEVGRGGCKCGGRGGRRGRVMKRLPGKSPAARRYGLKYVSFTTSITR